MAACRRQFRLMLAQGVLPDIDAVIDAVLAGEAPSYYVEYEYTLRCLKSVFAPGRPVRIRTGSRVTAQKWNDICRDVAAVLCREPDADLGAIAWDLARGEFGSPRFYITRRQARRIIARNNASPTPLPFRYGLRADSLM